MILVDTSVWVDHLRRGPGQLAELLERGAVLCHPWVIGELALGQLSPRSEILELLADLPAVTVATPSEVLVLVDRHGLQGSGLGYVDAQLLASTLMTPGAALWSRDRRLAAAAAKIGCDVDPR